MCGKLHLAAKQGGLGHRAFSRPFAGQLGIIEKTLDSILSEMGDEAGFVEYWTRQEWRSIEAHADVDEFLAKNHDVEGSTNSSDFRYPTNGHVLYLQVGSEVKGPTCVFPDRRSGSELLSGDPVELVVVPAVPGRLLRFGGDYLHAVPRPANLWLLKFVQGAPKYEPEEEFGRSVILFNTWTTPPLDVPLDVPIEADGAQEGNTNEISEWKMSDSLDHSDGETTCDLDGDRESISAKIWLLGNLRRRGHPMRTLKLNAPARLAEALHESEKPTRHFLTPVDP